MAVGSESSHQMTYTDQRRRKRRLVLKATLMAAVGYFGASALSHFSGVSSPVFALTAAPGERTENQRISAFAFTGAAALLSLGSFVDDALTRYAAIAVASGAGRLAVAGRALPTGEVHGANPVGLGLFAVWVLAWDHLVRNV